MKNKIKKTALILLTATVLCVPFLIADGVNAQEESYDKGYTPSAYEDAGIGAGMTTRTISEILSDVMKFLLFILGFLALLVFIIAGIMYLTSGGDETKTEKAKKWIIYAVVGIAVALIGLVILTLVNSLLGIT